MKDRQSSLYQSPFAWGATDFAMAAQETGSSQHTWYAQAGPSGAGQRLFGIEPLSPVLHLQNSLPSGAVYRDTQPVSAGVFLGVGDGLSGNPE